MELIKKSKGNKKSGKDIATLYIKYYLLRCMQKSR